MLAAGDPELPKVWHGLIDRVYKRNGIDGIDAATFREMSGSYWKGVEEGYGKTFTSIDYDTPDYDMLRHLEQDVFKFSAAKSYQVNKQLTQLLRDGKTVRTFEQFRSEALGILGVWVDNWGRAEYNTAVASAQMAAKWEHFEQHAEDMPLLKYTTVGDARVREAHRVLDGTIKPIGDKFWSQYYPPNGWNCRCSAIQLAGEHTETPDSEIEYPEVPAMFRKNLAKEKLVFPDDHPYYEGVPKKVFEQAKEMLPQQRQYEPVYKGRNGKAERHTAVDTNAPDYRVLERIATELAQKGAKVEILPELNENDPAREELFKGAKPNKNPDLRVDGKYYEVKDPETPYGKNTLSNNIHRGVQQANHVIVNLNQHVDNVELGNIAKGRFKTHPELQEVQFRYKGKYIVFTRKN